ncbi:MAG TPA: hypothetical protein VK853_02035 [Ilumatobacteraceae bacterium]|nr:hypothetical protein [Ilumatobacteraceae bacterium]
MRTRTLLLLSVGVALAILLAGGVFLFQLSNETASVEPAEIGQAVSVGDVDVTVLDVVDGDPVLSVEVELGGVDDSVGVDSFALVTGDRRLAPITAPADGRCVDIVVEMQRCRLDFDVSGAEGTSRVLVLRRGDEQRNWVLTSS